MLLTLLLTLTQSQSTTLTISNEASCSGCDIIVRRTMRLGQSDGDGAFASRPYVVARDSRGRFYVVTPETSGEVPFVFDSRGRFVQRLGRVGDGPGEYRNPISIMVRRDSVYVLDRQQGRLTVLAPSWRYARSFQGPPGAWSAIALDSGGFVINGRVKNAQRIGIPYHRFDATGNYLGSFGSRNERIDPRNNTIDNWWLTPGSHNSFWAVPYSHRYVIDHWSADGQLLRSLERRVPWFPRFDSLWNITPEQPPYPIMMGSWSDDQGLVWVLVGIGDRDWARGLGTRQRGEGGGVYYKHEDRQKIYDTLVEIIDPATGQLVTSRRLDGTLDVVIGSGLVGGVRETEDGVFLDVFAISLNRRGL